MKTFLVLCVAASLTGCAVYPAPGYDTYGNAGPVPYRVEQPVYLYGGGTVYHSDSYPYQRPWGYSRPPPPPHVVVVPGPPPGRPFVRGLRPGRGHGHGDSDSDGDGIPNRVDRDRNNNGVPNRLDRSRDRDGDGISNRMDPRPDIPNRR